jgi:hypothetical protein
MLNPCRLPLLFTLILLLAAGCGQSKPAASTPPLPQPPQQFVAPAPKEAIPRQETASETNGTCRDEQSIQQSERNRAACFHFQPAATTTKVISQQVPAHTAKSTTKKGQKTAGKAPMTTVTKVVRTTGRCQPQSLIYGRCRTGFMTCRLGDTSPVQWFACAQKNNNTTSTPTAGSIIVLDVNTRRGMPTGHPAYVEEVKKNGNGTWNLRISHTNYDRKCHLDLDAQVLFDPQRMTVSFLSGPWSTWAKGLKALGFILR